MASDTEQLAALQRRIEVLTQVCAEAYQFAGTVGAPSPEDPSKDWHHRGGRYQVSVAPIARARAAGGRARAAKARR